MLSFVAITSATASVARRTATVLSVHVTGFFTRTVHQDNVTCWFDKACSQR